MMAVTKQARKINLINVLISLKFVAMLLDQPT
jgi:hypothetical protein